MTIGNSGGCEGVSAWGIRLDRMGVGWGRRKREQNGKEKLPSRMASGGIFR